MSFEITGNVDPQRVFCTGSFSKLLTTFVCLSFLSEKMDLSSALDDSSLFDSMAETVSAKQFLEIFHKKIEKHFTLRDICTHYAGLPYTFDVAEDEIIRVETGQPFKHHSILSEAELMLRCQRHITPVYRDRCKFHYSEISIIFLGYFLEKVYDIKIKELYQQYLITPFHLKHSLFSNMKIPGVYCRDLSDKYDYPSIAILDHGYFSYSNGFFTTLEDMKILLGNLLMHPIFKNDMTDIQHARAASGRIMNGLSVEIRQVGDDILYGYEGLSYSGCNIWAYSTKQKKGFLTFTEDEEEAYNIYGLLGYSEFDKVPKQTESIYQNFLKNYHEKLEKKAVPSEFQGKYQRVMINEKELEILFSVDAHSMTIRNPDEIQYELICLDGTYRIHSKDKTHGAKVGFVQSEAGEVYMYFDGTLYKKIALQK